ncbi:MAG: hypothetical protein CISAcid_00700 [uncultured Acidilobus sp. CIS]|nr:MAG: hypothetical protein CISAcid_00700 [uncultured Acidilobus sp. CIS]
MAAEAHAGYERATPSTLSAIMGTLLALTARESLLGRPTT